MGKLTVFAFVVLFGVLRGLLQRRQVKAELEERMTKARTKALQTRLPARSACEAPGLAGAGPEKNAGGLSEYGAGVHRSGETD